MGRSSSAFALLAGFLAALLTAGAAPAHAASTIPPGGQPYGLIAFDGNFVPGKTVAERTASYRRLYDAGVRAIRLDLPWAEIEPPGPPLHDYNFSRLDAEVQAITGAGMKVIGILGYGHPDYSSRGAFVNQTPAAGGIPPFYIGSAQYFPPDNPADFAAYARATAQHFRGQVIAWEVWNEENEGWRFWPPHEDPAAYARLLCAAHGQLEQVDPGKPVLFGGLFFPAVADQPGTSAPDYIDQAYGAYPPVARCSDAIAYHPYPYPFTAPELDVPIRGSVLSAYDQMGTELRKVGDGGKPLWITEVGWPTHSQTYGVPEEKQAEYTARTMAASFAQGVPVLTWYTYGDYPNPTGADQESSFGFFRADGTPKPAYFALKTFAATFAGTRFETDLSKRLGLPGGGLFTGGRAFALRYGAPDRRVTALWYANESVAEGQGALPPGGTAGPATVHVEVPVSSRSVQVVDYLGRTRTVAASAKGTVPLDLGPAPQYVVDPLPVVTTRTRGVFLGLTCAARGVRVNVQAFEPIRRVTILAGRKRLATLRHAPFRTVLRLRRHSVVTVDVRLASGRVTVRRRPPDCSRVAGG